MYRCMIVDDEVLARKLLTNHIEKITQLEIVASCSSAIEAINVLATKDVDLIFLDIQMPGLLGTDFYKHLVVKPAVIFTTAYRDYAVEGFELAAVDYLVKPITFGRFSRAVARFKLTQSGGKQFIEPSENPTEAKKYMFVTEDRKQVKVVFDRILFVESVKNYVKIVTDTQTHLVKYSLSAMELALDSNFLRVHRSYIVNKEKVTAFTKNDVEIGSLEIPIGKQYREALEGLL
ncbi:Chemotaxis protein CheY [Tenacibaculum litopenaei]|uniref:LytR/AlgR family response regulator transcription factor n=1 Tax=Tenacibaculum litopenaei TaxID=396016 RepID=UPI00389514E3